VTKKSFWFLLFLTIHVSSLANECKVINAVCSPNWYPVSFISSKNEAKGVAIGIMRALAKESQLDIEFNCNIPWPRANLYMNLSKVDMLVGHYLNIERKQNWIVSDILFLDDIRAVYLDPKIEVNRVEDLKGLIGVKPRGASFGTTIDKQISKKALDFKMHEVNNMEAMIGLLLSRRVDYILSDEKDIRKNVELYDLVGKVIISDSLTSVSVHFSFAKQSPCAKHLEHFNALIKAYKTSGFIDELFEQAKNDYKDISVTD